MGHAAVLKQRTTSTGAAYEKLLLGFVAVCFFIAAIPNTPSAIGYGGFAGAAVLSLLNPFYGVLSLLLSVFVPVRVPNIPVVFMLSAIIGFRLMLNILRLRMAKTQWMYLAYCVTLMIGATHSPSVDMVEKYLYFAFRGIAIYFMLELIGLNRQRIIELCMWVALCGAIAFTMNYIHFITGYTQQWINIWSFNPEREAKRIIAYGSEPNYFAGLAICTVGISYAVIAICKTNITRIIAIAISLLCHAAIFGTYSKSGIIAIGVGAIVFAGSNPKRLISLAIFGTLAAFGMTLYSGLLERYSTIASNISEHGGTGRFYLWGIAYDEWISSPISILFGNGMGWFENTFKVVSHNTPVTLLVDEGLISAMIYLAFILMNALILNRLTKRLKGVDPTISILARGVLASLAGSLVMHLTITELGAISIAVVTGIASGMSKLKYKNVYAPAPVGPTPVERPVNPEGMNPRLAPRV